MEENILLVVEDSWTIRGRGVVLTPDFSVPEAGWKHRQQVVCLETPDGTIHEMIAHIDLAHFTLVDPNATADQKNRVIVRLEDATEKPPVGTKVYASQNLCDALVGQKE